LCTNLTLDQAISQARSIRSIVLTIPVQAFQLDRGGGVVALVERVRERFLGIMEPGKIDAVPHYVVLTKSEHVQPAIVDNVKDGRRFEVLRGEIQKEIDAEYTKSAPNIPRIQGLERQKGIWQAFLSLCEREAIEAPNFQNKKRPKLLIKKYTDPVKQVPKSQYIDAMNTPGMKRRFGETLELSTSSWRMVFEKYLVELPKEIARYEANMTQAGEEVERLNRELATVNTEREALHRKNRKLKKIVADKGALTREVQDRLAELKDDRLRELECSMESNERNIKELYEVIGKIEIQLDQKRAEIRDCEGGIKSHEALIKELSSDPMQVVLFNRDFRGIDKVTSRYWKSSEDRKQCHAELGENREGHYSGREDTLDCSQFKGVTEETLVISKDFQIVPQDKDQRAGFEKNAIGGEYRAEYRGADYEIDLGAKPSPCGTKVCYGFKMKWYGGTRRPWLEVVHTIPGYDYHNATIIELRGMNDSLRENIISVGCTIDRLKRDIETHREDIRLLEKAIGRSGRELAILKKEIQKDLVRDMISEQKVAIVEKETRQNRALKKIAQFRRDTKEWELSKLGVQKKKRHFAVLIHSEWETVKVLRELSDVVVNRGESVESKVQESSLKQCCEFIQNFDATREEIRKKVEEELKLVSA